ncbi:MAG TPA: ABC transporter substrate-binding protein [Fimbriimonadaceae bacterium]|nr:ABC transporter substrate-binding protein [Fimbriimonadaceae bacterium]
MNLNPLVLPGCAVAILASVWGMERISDRTEPPGPIHIAYWEKWTGFERDAMQAVVDDFNKSQNRIHVDLVATSDVGNKTMFAVSAGCPPDVAGLWGDNVAHYADDRAVIPLDDFCRQYGITAADYIPCYWKLVNYDGHTWALPSTPSSSALHYNTALLRKLGFDPDRPPKTIEELTRMSDAMTFKKNGHLEKAGFMPSQPGNWNWGWGYLFGGKLWDGEDKITTDTPENIRAFDWIQSFSRKFGRGEAEAFKNSFGNVASPQNPFIAGQVVFELEGVWTHNFVHKYAPDIKLGVAPFPYPADRPDLAGSTFVGEDILCIPRGAPHPKEAFEFIRFVQTQPEMEKLCLLQEKNSPLDKVSDHFWKVHGNPNIHIYDELARGKNTIRMPQMGIWPEFSEELENTFDEISLMDVTPKQALRDLQVTMQSKLDRYNARLEERRRLGL